MNEEAAAAAERAAGAPLLLQPFLNLFASNFPLSFHPPFPYFHVPPSFRGVMSFSICGAVRKFARVWYSVVPVMICGIYLLKILLCLRFAFVPNANAHSCCYCHCWAALCSSTAGTFDSVPSFVSGIYDFGISINFVI